VIFQVQVTPGDYPSEISWQLDDGSLYDGPSTTTLYEVSFAGASEEHTLHLYDKAGDGWDVAQWTLYESLEGGALGAVVAGPFSLGRGATGSEEFTPITHTPTAAPTNLGDTHLPTAAPTAAPTDSPTATPTAVPTNSPTAMPTADPTNLGETHAPTTVPTASPTPAARMFMVRMSLGDASFENAWDIDEGDHYDYQNGELGEHSVRLQDGDHTLNMWDFIGRDGWEGAEWTLYETGEGGSLGAVVAGPFTYSCNNCKKKSETFSVPSLGGSHAATPTAVPTSVASTTVSSWVEFETACRTLLESSNSGLNILLSASFLMGPYTNYCSLSGRILSVQCNGATLDAAGGGGLFVAYASETPSSLELHDCTLKNASNVAGSSAVKMLGVDVRFDEYGRPVRTGQGFTLKVYNSVFEHNGPSEEGAAIQAWDGDVEIHNSTFQDNIANFGGAVSYRCEKRIFGKDPAKMLVRNCEFKRNLASKVSGVILSSPSAGGDGGALYLIGSDVVEIHDCIFITNIAHRNGGAIHLGVSLADSVFEHNGVSLELETSRCVFHNNTASMSAEEGVATEKDGTASFNGGGIYANDAVVGLIQATFGGNFPDPYFGFTFRLPRCEAGFFQNTTSKSCEECLVGTYKSATDPEATVCTSCAEGRFGKQTIRRSNSIYCTKCPAGYFGPLSSASSCIACPKGRYGQFPGETEASCTSACPEIVNETCAAGTASPESPMPGHYLTNIKDQKACPSGKFQPTLSFGACSVCPLGMHANGSGLTHCTDCQPGQYAANSVVTLCPDCPAGKYSASRNAMKCTECELGKFQNDAGKPFCNAVAMNQYMRRVAIRDMQGGVVRYNVEPTECPQIGLLQEVSCGTNGDGDFQFSDNFWRDGLQRADLNGQEWLTDEVYKISEATKFYKCVGKCNVAKYEGKITCGDGSSGVLCSQCSSGYYVTSSGACGQCNTIGSSAVIALAACIMDLLMAVISANFNETTRQRMGVLSNRLLSYWKRVVGINFKLFLTFIQMILLFRYVYLLTYPESYLKFLGVLSIFSFNLFEMFHLRCLVGDINFLDQMYVVGSLTFCLELAIGAMLLVQTSKTASASLKARLGQIQGILDIAVFVGYPFTSSMLFQVHNCRAIDQVSYLHSDYSVFCDTAEHQSAVIFSGFLITFVAVGTPLMYLLRLRPHRDEILSLLDRNKSGAPSRHLRFLWGDYKPRLYYWEAVVCTLKLLLTGFVVWFEPGSLLQIVVGMMMLFLYVILLLQCKPYLSPAHNGLAIFQSSMVFLSLLAALLLKIGASSNTDLGYSSDFVTGALITTAGALVVSTVCSALRDAQLAVVKVVVSVPETSWPPQRKTAYNVGAIVRSGGWSKGKYRNAEVLSNVGDKYTLRQLNGNRHERQNVPAADIEGELHDVMSAVAAICRARADMCFGYDWAGSSTEDERDSVMSIRTNGSYVQSRLGPAIDFGDAVLVENSYWFKGYCDSVRAQTKTLLQMPQVTKVRLVCIRGGPVTQLEERTMRTLAKEATEDLLGKGLNADIDVITLDFVKFKANFNLRTQLCRKREHDQVPETGHQEMATTTTNPMLEQNAVPAKQADRDEEGGGIGAWEGGDVAEL
jgi:hypothetical protein